MKINKDSNFFTFSFAIIMVLVVAISLAFVSESLSSMKKANKEDKKKINILSAIKVQCDRTNASELYDEYIKESVVINSLGETVVGDNDAFYIDVKKQYRNTALAKEDKVFPLFIAEKDGNKYYITPLVGSGLWGPIWGFVAFEKDCNTVFGASFDHKTETPGLGAEIRESFFEDEFIGKKILDENSSFVSINVVKGGAKEGSYHEVDGITGGTITSDGVTNMLKADLGIYNNYFKTIRN
jgi:Na+-transporting NADH:ubiquinone oxidoreductase subunit C